MKYETNHTESEGFRFPLKHRYIVNVLLSLCLYSILKNTHARTHTHGERERESERTCIPMFPWQLIICHHTTCLGRILLYISREIPSRDPR